MQNDISGHFSLPATFCIQIRQSLCYDFALISVRNQNISLARLLSSLERGSGAPIQKEVVEEIGTPGVWH